MKTNGYKEGIANNGVMSYQVTPNRRWPERGAFKSCRTRKVHQRGK